MRNAFIVGVDFHPDQAVVPKPVITDNTESPYIFNLTNLYAYFIADEGVIRDLSIGRTENNAVDVIFIKRVMSDVDVGNITVQINPAGAPIWLPMAI